MELYQRGGSKEDLIELIGRARPKKGMFEGDIEAGELQIGQIGGLIKEVKPAQQIVAEIIEEFEKSKQEMRAFSFYKTAEIINLYRYDFSYRFHRINRKTSIIKIVERRKSYSSDV